MSFALDGAIVMLGRSTEIVTRIKERNKYLFITHCITHRLALACNLEKKKVDFCNHVKDICYCIFVVFLHFLLNILGYFFSLSKVIEQTNMYTSNVDLVIEVTLSNI